MNHQNIDHNPERISELKPFISNYNWKDIEFPSHLKDWKKFECNNKTTALNILFVPYKKKTHQNKIMSRIILKKKIMSEAILKK